MYFFELREQYSTKAWYIALQSSLTIGFGLIALVVPEFAVYVLLAIIAVGLFLDAFLQIWPLLRGNVTWHLWPQVLFRSISGWVVGLLVFTHKNLAIEVLGVIFGILLIARSFLVLLAFVETPMRVRHQRAMLIDALISFAAGIVLFFSPFHDEFVFNQLLGVYAVVIGWSHLTRAWRISEEITHNEAHAHTLMSLRKEIPIVKDTEPDQIVEELGLLVPGDDSSDWIPATPGTKLDTTKYKRAMIFAPHPDDLEGFTGGLVYKLTHGATSVVFAGGDRGVWSSEYAQMSKQDYVHVRLEESAEAARILGVKEIIYMGYFDRGVKCTPEAVEKVLEVMQRHQPDLVVCFEYYQRATLYPHPDHIAAAQIVRNAVVGYENNHLMDYLVASTLIPNLVIDVSGVRRIKLEALACHTSQTKLNAIIFPFLEKFITKLWGAFIGVDYAEGYRLVNIPAMMKRLGVSHEQLAQN